MGYQMHVHTAASADHNTCSHEACNLAGMAMIEHGKSYECMYVRRFSS